MDQYAILARLLDGSPTDRGIGAPPAVSGHEADRLAGLARSRAREQAPTAAWWRRRLAAAAPARETPRGTRRRTSGATGAAEAT
ncbi:hypothetical protein [Streptomyces otsuchiensis]|uniref:hypothetical protein n=1 Tax=Streptomyces otsuchiensis TaxID=2681388 RepID=UPI001030B9A6|nr:hypothetical protein [Streptomyces otsuchiensis]